MKRSHTRNPWPFPLAMSLLALQGAAALLLSPASAAMAAPVVSGSTITASDCSYPAVNDAVGLAKSIAMAGLTVVIPAGTCSWGSDQLIVPGRIALRGAGRDLTIIKRTGVVNGAFLVKFDCGVYKNANFSHMTLAGANPFLSLDRGLGLIGTCVDFKVSNAKFTHFSNAGIEVRGGPTQSGVIFSNQFVNNFHQNYGYGVVVYGNAEWPELKLGMEKDPLMKYPSAVFVEDNYMLGNRHHIASNNGARYVFRNNTAIANDLTKNYPQVDAHGKGSWDRGTRSWEVYRNRFSANLTSGTSIAIGMRGGDGVIFGNTYDPKISKPVQLSMENQHVDYTNPANNCKDYPAGSFDKITDAYIYETVANPVTNQCPLLIRAGIDYRMGMRPGYTPFTYPHPLRSN